MNSKLTRNEIEAEKHKLINDISTYIHNIQVAVNSMRDPEDEGIIRKMLNSIQRSSENIQMTYFKIDELNNTIPDEDTAYSNEFVGFQV